MAREGKWYTQGYDDGRTHNSLADPPWQKGHRDHENYMAGFRDGRALLEREADREEEE